MMGSKSERKIKINWTKQNLKWEPAQESPGGNGGCAWEIPNRAAIDLSLGFLLHPPMKAASSVLFTQLEEIAEN